MTRNNVNTPLDQWRIGLIQDLIQNSDRPLRIDGIVLGHRNQGTHQSTTRGVLDISSVLDALGQNTRVNVLSLSNLQLGQLEVDCFLSMMRRNHTLTTLELGNVSLKDGFDDVGEMVVKTLSENTTITTLKLETCQITHPDTLKRLLHCHPSLQVLQLYRLPGIARLFDPVTCALPFHMSTLLERLDICGCSLRDDQVHGLLTVLLQHSNIVSLNLDHNQLGSEWTARILRNILLRSSTITTPTTTNDLSSSIHQRPHLQHLSLQHNNFSGKAAAILASALMENTSLLSLRMSHNPLGDDGALAFATALSHNTTLRELAMSHTEIWYLGCKALCQALSQWRGLVTLRVDGNDCERCIPDILEHIQENWRLETFFFADDDHNDDDSELSQMRRKIQLVLQWNRAKRRLLREPLVPAALWPRVLSGATLSRPISPDVLYYLLLEQPDMISWWGSS